MLNTVVIFLYFVVCNIKLHIKKLILMCPSFDFKTFGLSFLLLLKPLKPSLALSKRPFFHCNIPDANYRFNKLKFCEAVVLGYFSMK